MRSRKALAASRWGGRRAPEGDGEEDDALMESRKPTFLAGRGARNPEAKAAAIFDLMAQFGGTASTVPDAAYALLAYQTRTQDALTREYFSALMTSVRTPIRSSDTSGMPGEGDSILPPDVNESRYASFLPTVDPFRPFASRSRGFRIGRHPRGAGESTFRYVPTSSPGRPAESEQAGGESLIKSGAARLPRTGPRKVSGSFPHSVEEAREVGGASPASLALFGEASGKVPERERKGEAAPSCPAGAAHFSRKNGWASTSRPPMDSFAGGIAVRNRHRGSHALKPPTDEVRIRRLVTGLTANG